ncbi:MAG: hypothetical protein FWG40_10180 [Peptococcaceae bacterium]|nr:hypothetical protein [Peptococcaceae bacterium]
METLLTPRNATKIVTTPRSLTLNSDQSLADLVAFYEKALKKLDAEQTSRIELKGWYYTGRYDSSKYITISISYIESKDHHLIVISY